MSRDRMDLLQELKDYSWDQEGWFAPLSAALAGVGPAEAAWQPPGGGNTIWQTVNHLNYYNERTLHRLTGAPLGSEVADNDASFGSPGDPLDHASWQATLERTHWIAVQWRQALVELNDTDLAKPLASNTLGDVLPHLIMHDAYHAGQIVLLRKQQGAWPARRG